MAVIELTESGTVTAAAGPAPAGIAGQAIPAQVGTRMPRSTAA